MEVSTNLLATKVIKEMNFDCDIIITDPCYIKYGEYYFPDVDHIENSTLYGDWSCHVWKAKDYSECTEENVIGQFCADSGMVIVANYNQLLKVNPESETFVNEHPWCATVIKGFKGKVQMIQFDREYTYTDDYEPDNPYGWRKGDTYKDQALELFGIGNINWIGAQTGL